MLATDFIKNYPSACEEAVEWINSLGEGVTAEEAWEICPSGPWMAWIASKVGVPEEERWVWADLTRLWTADFLDGVGVNHGLYDCSPIVDEDSAYAAVCSAASLHASSACAARAAINCSSRVAMYAANFADTLLSAEVIRERIQNPFRRN